MIKSWCFSKCNIIIILIFKLTLLLQLKLYSSLSANHFGDCITKTCGDVNISYPFYMIDQQKSYCGYPGFEVICKDEKFPYINISGVSFVIKNVSYEDQTLQVINSMLLEAFDDKIACFGALQGLNLTLNNEKFKYRAKHSEIFLILNCPPKILEQNSPNWVICEAVGVYKNESRLKDLEGKCKGVVSVPYDGERTNIGNVKEILEEGFSLKWLANNCSTCRVSGGQCGYDQDINEFSCFCPDRTHAYGCVLKKKKNHLPLILGLGIMSSVFVVAALIALCWYCKKIKSAHSKYISRSTSLDQSASDVDKGNIYFGVPLFSYSELKEATDSFDPSKELGDGGFGTVYYGKLKDGREVAVKRLYEKNYKRVEQFMNEVQLLTCLRHQNLVSLYGCTSHHSRELLLVYEYVTNGTVADHLYGEKAKDGSLSWSVRLKIATETASALSYLHASDIIHRDVKTNNILLDSTFSVKVADFGLSRLFPNDVTHVSTAPQGTPGYLDPEYGQCYQLTDKSDVYSFGVVLVELISSLPAVDFNRHRHEINLSNYALTRIQRSAFEELVDPQLGFKSDFRVRRMTTAVGELAFRCLQHDKELRPAMDEVFEILRRIESTDYEVLHEEEMARNDTGAQVTFPKTSPTEDDYAKLLTDKKLCPSSPLSVMDKWGSISTTPNASN
ncbi:hypothetical protein RND81_07G038800 [Saponaria officinalis]|uniref:non-specific serine/threonine protein kinase n=1 Tax=Saponaria officinalis TaxID=3572 RepID=A0AAW1JQD9_SAPOF